MKFKPVLIDISLFDNPNSTCLPHLLIHKPHINRIMIHQSTYAKTLIHYTTYSNYCQENIEINIYILSAEFFKKGMYVTGR